VKLEPLVADAGSVLGGVLACGDHADPVEDRLDHVAALVADLPCHHPLLSSVDARRMRRQPWSRARSSGSHDCPPFQCTRQPGHSVRPTHPNSVPSGCPGSGYITTSPRCHFVGSPSSPTARSPAFGSLAKAASSLPPSSSSVNV